MNKNLTSPSLDDSLEDVELIFALVGPIGVDMTAIQGKLKSALKQMDYTTHIIHITKVLDGIIDEEKVLKSDKSVNKSDTEMEKKISITSRLCNLTGENAILSALAISEIIDSRKKLEEKGSKKRAYIIRQIKRPDELLLLKKVYGKQLVQISATLEKQDRIDNLKRAISKEGKIFEDTEILNICNKIIQIDENENLKNNSGQNVRDIYHEADFFLTAKLNNEISRNLLRFVEALFGKNEIGPTRDEYGSYLAVAASLRSCDLSRQIGASIMNDDGNILSIGCNEVSKAGGGQYWYDDDYKSRDIDLNWEGNKDRINQILNDSANRLSEYIYKISGDTLSKDDIVEILSDSLIGDITEFGRMAHAEMSAICEAAKLGVSLKNSTMYATTFPCHNCAKHIIASGIMRLVFIEPYPKSRALNLYFDSITLSQKDKRKVVFEHFEGISPRRYRDIFQKSRKRREKDGSVKEWYEGKPRARVEGIVSDRAGREKHAVENILTKIKKYEKLK